ncbi:Choline dehydrogenase [Fontimonas thermophila]|uniref:Choline dehydrogenase n=1 Tax=Fontimonas thermophila TaxID=1076937 RepID=A0A1I2J5H7_9GAMM|nr:choline dehydrogenase [Fontimonas thermophila]SFF48487.1 Choline dehydrogenase [Fontimonas thermophila]
MYDYVIVGGGSAGCVLANRLSADGHHRVCLLEAGPRDDSPLIRMPAGVIALMRSSTYNWQFWTAPQPAMGGRRLYWPRGRTLGGSSSINAMCYIRGNAWDYDHWAALGNPGWSYAEVLPYFKRLENFEPGADEFHGTGGPLNVTRLRQPNPLSAVYLEAARQAGYAHNPDFNGARQEGMGYYHVAQKDGERCSNARAYLRPAEGRSNLEILTGVHATRVLFEGRRAVGVRYYAGGVYREVHARREVILSAGAVGSPHLLLLSGVGPAEELRRHAISVIHELPGVGKNLQDHLDVLVSMRSRTRLGFSFHPLSLVRSLKALVQYLFGRRGELTSNIAEAGGFLKSDPSEVIPDLQFHFVPLVNAHHGLDLRPLFRYYGYSILACDLRPRSRGEIRLASADPLVPPEIDPRHFEDPRDLDKLVIAIRKAREIFAQPAFAPHNAEELEPGPGVRSDDELRQWVREHAETLYHPVGTCKMGADPMAVVDARLRVHGLSGLRVVDASIMPTLVGGNTNAPTTMIAEKGADMILADARMASH